MKKYEILGIGAPFLDHVVKVSHEFLASLSGAKGGMEIVDYATFVKILHNTQAVATLIAGGSSANTIKGLANLGHSCALVGKIGQDRAGDTFLKSIQELGILSHFIPISTPTGQLACLVTPDGERTFRDYLGAGQEMQKEDLDPAHFHGVRHVHIEGYTLLNVGLARRAMELAKQAKATVSFDLANFEIVRNFKAEIADLMREHIDILFANRDEVLALCQQSAEEACDSLRQFCKVVVVSMGVEGCWLGNAKERMHCPAFPVKPLDTTGAGDLFAAGFLHGYLTGKPLTECAKFGALISREVVQVLGAEIPRETWHQLKKILR